MDTLSRIKGLAFEAMRIVGSCPGASDLLLSKNEVPQDNNDGPPPPTGMA